MLSLCRDKVTIIEEIDRSYHIKFLKVHTSEIVASVQSNLKDNKLRLQHRQLGHLNIKNM